MAKATEEDLSEMKLFFTHLELMELEDWQIDLSDYEEENQLELGYLKNFDTREQGVNYSDENYCRGLFINHWFKKLDWRWRRVVWGCGMLIDNCCDPDLSYLEFRPDIKAFLDSQEEE